jgi:Ser/Thr protein kinase RdoA (MazF antagonist)
VRRWLGRFIGRIHAVGARRSFAHRIRLDVDSYGLASRDFLVDDGRPARPRAPTPGSRSSTPRSRLPRRVRRAPTGTLRLHGDCHLGNVLWTERGPHFVDLDDAVNGPAIQDLWMLLSGDRRRCRRSCSTCSRATSRSWSSTGARSA